MFFGLSERMTSPAVSNRSMSLSCVYRGCYKVVGEEVECGFRDFVFVLLHHLEEGGAELNVHLNIEQVLLDPLGAEPLQWRCDLIA